MQKKMLQSPNLSGIKTQTTCPVYGQFGFWRDPCSIIFMYVLYKRLAVRLHERCLKTKLLSLQILEKFSFRMSVVQISTTVVSSLVH